MKSMAGNRLRNGVFAAFFLLLAVYLGCYFLLAVTSGPYQSTDRMDAETAMRFGHAVTPLLRIVLTVLGSAITAVFLFAAVRLSRGASGILALVYTLILTGVVTLPSLIILRTINSSFVSLLSILDILSTALLCWLLTPWLARRINEPVSILIVLILNSALSCIFAVSVTIRWNWPLVQNLAGTFGGMVWTAFKSSVQTLFPQASVIFLVYALLYWIFRPKKASPEGLDNG